MAEIGTMNGAPVYESIGEVEDLTKPWFVIPPEVEPPMTADFSWDGWTDVGFTTDA